MEAAPAAETDAPPVGTDPVVVDTAPPPTEDPPSQHSLPIETVIYYIYNNGLALLTQYGWYILLTVMMLVIVWSRLKPHYYQWKRKREEWIDEQNFDPARAERYQDAMLKAREKMQRDLNEKAVVYQEDKEKREAEKRDDRIKQWEEFKVVSNSKLKPQDKPGGDRRPSNRRDYFPLGGGGGGGGGGYRPPRRMVGRGG